VLEFQVLRIDDRGAVVSRRRAAHASAVREAQAAMKHCRPIKGKVEAVEPYGAL
jgi:hypothetical protein